MSWNNLWQSMVVASMLVIVLTGCKNTQKTEESTETAAPTENVEATTEATEGAEEPVFVFVQSKRISGDASDRQLGKAPNRLLDSKVMIYGQAINSSEDGALLAGADYVIYFGRNKAWPAAVVDKEIIVRATLGDVPLGINGKPYIKEIAKAIDMIAEEEVVEREAITTVMVDEGEEVVLTLDWAKVDARMPKIIKYAVNHGVLNIGITGPRYMVQEAEMVHEPAGLKAAMEALGLVYMVAPEKKMMVVEEKPELTAMEKVKERFAPSEGEAKELEPLNEAPEAFAVRDGLQAFQKPAWEDKYDELEKLVIAQELELLRSDYRLSKTEWVEVATFRGVKIGDTKAAAYDSLGKATHKGYAGEKATRWEFELNKEVSDPFIAVIDITDGKVSKIRVPAPPKEAAEGDAAETQPATQPATQPTTQEAMSK